MCQFCCADGIDRSRVPVHKVYQFSGNAANTLASFYQDLEKEINLQCIVVIDLSVPTI